MENTNHEYKKTYDECLCKNVIAYYYHEYDGFSKYESPDFINENVCLEIRKALYNEGGKLQSLIDKYQYAEYDAIPKRFLNSLGFKEEPKQSQENEHIFQQRSDVDNSLIWYLKSKDGDLKMACVFDHSLYNDQDQVIKEAIDEKTKKLNKNYLSRDINILGIIYYQQLSYQYEEVNSAIINSIVEKVGLAKEQSNNKYYDEIFILFKDCLLKINVDLLKYEKHLISNETLNQIEKNTKVEVSKL